MAVTIMLEMIAIGSVVDQVIIMEVITILHMDIGDQTIFAVGCVSGTCTCITTRDATWSDVLHAVPIALVLETAVETTVEMVQLFY